MKIYSTLIACSCHVASSWLLDTPPKGGGVERTARQHPRTFSLTPGGEVCLRGIKQKYSDFRQIWVGGGGVCSHLTDFPYGNKCNALAAFVVVVVLVIAVHQL